MPQGALARPTSQVPFSYEELKRRVGRALQEGRRRAQEVIEREKTQTYWEVGRLIDHFVSKSQKPGSEQAAYGKEIIPRLAQDLRTNETLLYNSLRFARSHKNLSTSTDLTWSHHRALLAVPDDQQRKALEKQAESNHWSSRELTSKIQELYGDLEAEDESEKPLPSALRPKKGMIGTYKIIQRGSGYELDLGFDCSKTLTKSQVGGLAVGTIVDSKLSRIPDANKSVLYTYEMRSEKVIDGDTFWAVADLGFGFRKREKIRLRGIDCPEMTSGSGQRAKDFVQQTLNHASDMVVTTSKTDDKYGRYLGDVYLTVKGEEIYLNKLLLDKGLAKLV